jgi:GT2 family glycosyltransferase
MNYVFTVSVLAYDNWTLTRRCLNSVLHGWAGEGLELILTDNGSEDGTGIIFSDMARDRPNILVQQYEENQGFIEPNRAAFRKAQGEYFVMLNNDCIVPPNWLQILQKPFLEDAKCAITGATGGELRQSGLGGFKGRVDYIEGFCMMVKKSAVAAVEPNLFAPELKGAYGEDSYLSLQMREAGYTIHVTPIPGLRHVGGATCAMVPQCAEWQADNHEALRKRFGGYLENHTFEK